MTWLSILEGGSLIIHPVILDHVLFKKELEAELWKPKSNERCLSSAFGLPTCGFLSIDILPRSNNLKTPNNT